MYTYSYYFLMLKYVKVSSFTFIMDKILRNNLNDVCRFVLKIRTKEQYHLPTCGPKSIS